MVSMSQVSRWKASTLSTYALDDGVELDVVAGDLSADCADVGFYAPRAAL